MSSFVCLPVCLSLRLPVPLERSAGMPGPARRARPGLPEGHAPLRACPEGAPKGSLRPQAARGYWRGGGGENRAGLRWVLLMLQH